MDHELERQIRFVDEDDLARRMKRYLQDKQHQRVSLRSLQQMAHDLGLRSRW